MSAKTSLRHQVISIYFVVEALDFRRLFNRIINTKPTPSLLQNPHIHQFIVYAQFIVFQSFAHEQKCLRYTRERNAPPLPSIAAIKSSMRRRRPFASSQSQYLHTPTPLSIYHSWKTKDSPEWHNIE